MSKPLPFSAFSFSSPFQKMVCSGCSRFKFIAEDQRCSPCTLLGSDPSYAPKPVNEWPLCNLCGSAYEFLTGAICMTCQERQGLSMGPPPLSSQAVSGALHSTSHLDPARDAMSNPVNPRTYSAPSNRNAAAVDPADDVCFQFNNIIYC